MVPYVDAVVAVTVMHVLLFVLHVCLLRECDDVGGTRGSGIVSSAADVWCMRCEELVEYVRCVCICLGAAWLKRGGGVSG